MASYFFKLCRVGCVTNSVIRQKQLVLTKPQIRLRTRWLHRRPVRVLSPADHNNPTLDKLQTERDSVISNKRDEHEIIELDSQLVSKIHNPTKFEVSDFAKDQHTTEEKSQPQRKKLPVIHRKTKEEKEATKHMKMEKSALKLGVPKFIKVEDTDTKLSQAVLIAKSRNRREKKDVILLEGKRLIADAIAAGHIPQMIFFSQVEDLKDLQLGEGIEVYKTTYKNISMWSDVVTSPGVIGIFKTPQVGNREPPKDSLPLTVVCDNVRDPGNMGSILRVAAGVGCSKVALTKGCVDLWEPKVLRAGAGAHFRLPIVKDLEWDDISSDNFIVLADSNANSLNTSPVPLVPYYAMDYSDLNAITLIIGGETEGLSATAFELARACNGVRVNIPLYNDVNSLNTATALGIIMFEMRRQIALAQQQTRIQLPNT